MLSFAPWYIYSFRHVLNLLCSKSVKCFDTFTNAYFNGEKHNWKAWQSKWFELIFLWFLLHLNYVSCYKQFLSRDHTFSSLRWLIFLRSPGIAVQTAKFEGLFLQMRKKRREKEKKRWPPPPEKWMPLDTHIRQHFQISFTISKQK